MQKIAANQTVTPDELRKIASIGFGVALAVPTSGYQPARVQQLSQSFGNKVKAAQARHTQLVELLRGELVPA